LLSDDELAEGAAREVAAFREIAPRAADAGVTIGMENGDPHLWEYGVLDKFGVPRELLVKHHARLCIGPIVRQLEAIDHPQVGLTLDIAHLHIAAHAIDFDYLESVRAAAPWVRHLHVNDNFGALDRGVEVGADRWAFGEADLHLPPGWGRIPYREVFARLPNYHGDLILEIKPGFHDCLPEALANTRAYLAMS
jgi:sugar phosphate isomerase/epimerase